MKSIHWLKSLIILPLFFLTFTACLQNAEQKIDIKLLCGADQTERYLPLLDGKRVGLVANHSSLINNTHLADSLLSLDVKLIRVFGPEHGFRGVADAGEHVVNGVDTKTGLPVVSLYGNNRKPTPDQLEGLDLILFDLQDVGVRFYTYISTLTYVMEAASENGIPLIILDRPNPNGFYIDGPVMEEEFTSFVGLHPIPIVYAMTIGEYGMMVNGEAWLKNGIKCDLTIISLKNYDRNKLYKLPLKPSPNLPIWQSVYLYPSLCLFEGTVVSVGRGTDAPFTCYGHPGFHIGSFTFKPEPREGAKHPKLEGEQCYGQSLLGYANNFREMESHINLQWLLGAYEHINTDNFFIPYFEKLAGNGDLRTQIKSGSTQEQIKGSWQDDINTFKETRKKYLIYEDFE